MLKKLHRDGLTELNCKPESLSRCIYTPRSQFLHLSTNSFSATEMLFLFVYIGLNRHLIQHGLICLSLYLYTYVRQLHGSNPSVWVKASLKSHGTPETGRSAVTWSFSALLCHAKSVPWVTLSPSDGRSGEPC